MKRKLFILLLAVVGALACVFGISACGEDGGGTGGNGKQAMAVFTDPTVTSVFRREYVQTGNDDKDPFNRPYTDTTELYAGESADGMYCEVTFKISLVSVDSTKVYKETEKSLDVNLALLFHYERLLNNAMTFSSGKGDKPENIISETELLSFATEFGYENNYEVIAYRTFNEETNAALIKEIKEKINILPCRKTIELEERVDCTPYGVVSFKDFKWNPAHKLLRDCGITMGELMTSPDAPRVEGNGILADLRSVRVNTTVDGIKYQIKFNLNYDWSAVNVETTVHDELEAYYLFEGDDLKFADKEFSADVHITGTGVNQIIHGIPLNTADAKNFNYSSYNSRIRFDYDVEGYLFDSIKVTMPVTFIVPDKAKLTVPDFRVDEWRKSPEGGKSEQAKITFSYNSGYSVDLKLSNADFLLSKNGVITTIDGAATQDLSVFIAEMQASKQPQTIYCSFNFGGITLSASAKFKITEAISHYKLENVKGIANEYFVGDELEFSQGIVLKEYYYDSYRAYSVKETKDREVAFDGEYINGFSTVKAGSFTMSVLKDGILNPESCTKINYTVKKNGVASIQPKLSLFFGTVVLGEPVDLKDCFLTVTYEKGNTEEIAMTENMLGELEQQTGEQEITVTYEGKTAQITVDVKAVKSISVFEGLEKYYMVTVKPQEVWLKVTFTDDDYDYIEVPEEKFESFDTSSEGNKSFNLTYGGKSLNWSYTVIKDAFISYTLVNNEITITGVNMGTPASDNAYALTDIVNVTIPAEIEGAAVTKIAANAFKSKTFIKKIVLPESITEIGNDAFRNNTSLKELNIPELTKMGTAIADGCTKLEKLTVTGATQLKNYFQLYKKKTMTSNAVYPSVSETLNVVISGTTLCDNFLEDLQEGDKVHIAMLTFGENLTSLGEQSVYGLKLVADFASEGDFAKVEDKVVYIDEGATLYYYQPNKQNKQFTVPASVTKIMTFAENEFIEEVVVEGDLTELGEYFMDGCDNLVSAKFNGSLEVLSANAFRNCTKMTEIKFPSGLREIGGNAFYYTALKEVIIPNTVTKVGLSAFMHCKCERLYIPTGATQSFNKKAGAYDLYMNNLKTLAYDGSLAYTSGNLSVYSRTITTLYITGEQTAKCEFANASGIEGHTASLTKIYVCKNFTAANFDKGYVSKSKFVFESDGITIDKWWL